MELLNFHVDFSSLFDVAEIVAGFFLGIGASIRFLKPRDVTFFLQVLILAVRLMKWLAKQHHPIKKSSNMGGVDEDLTKIHAKLLADLELPPVNH
jgi:hypothetical protein